MQEVTGSTPVFSTKKDTICSCPFFVENKYRHSLLNPPFVKGRTCYLTLPLRGRNAVFFFVENKYLFHR